MFTGIKKVISQINSETVNVASMVHIVQGGIARPETNFPQEGRSEIITTVTFNRFHQSHEQKRKPRRHGNSHTQRGEEHENGNQICNDRLDRIREFGRDGDGTSVLVMLTVDVLVHETVFVEKSMCEVETELVDEICGQEVGDLEIEGSWRGGGTRSFAVLGRPTVQIIERVEVFPVLADVNEHEGEDEGTGERDRDGEFDESLADERSRRNRFCFARDLVVLEELEAITGVKEGDESDVDEEVDDLRSKDVEREIGG